CRLSYQNGGTWCRFKARDYVVLVAYWTRNHVYPEAYPNHEIGAILSSEPQTSCASWRQDFSCYVSTGIHDMPVICGCFFSTTIAPWKQKDVWLFIPLHSGRKISRSIHCSGSNDQLPKQIQLGYDPSEELLGLPDPKSRNISSSAAKTRSWFGPNGQYIRELPCPSCRGRGYTPCSECGIERSRLDCLQCSGKGIMTCGRCSGDRVIWEESIDEQPWEKARSSSAFKVKEDDEVDNLEIKLETKKKSKRVYQSPSPEVGLKISRSLKSLNAKTGLFSNRMKIIHSDPKLSAERAASIKKAKGTAAARKRTSESLKAFFSDPENRQKRSISMQGIRFYCTNCGREGHRKHYCPELKNHLLDRRFRCRFCGEKGHNIRTCLKYRQTNRKITSRRDRLCRICRQSGHNQRTCSQVTGLISTNKSYKQKIRRKYSCRICHQKGHNRRRCPQVTGLMVEDSVMKKGFVVATSETRSRTYICSSCKSKGHNVRTCPNRSTEPTVSDLQANGGS
ncbi:unnamed protein product, partial [Linum tenue]